MGIMDKLKEGIAQAKENAQASAQVKETVEQNVVEKKNVSNIPIATGTIWEPYDVLDSIIALDFHQEGIFASADPSKAFDKVKVKLREKCLSLGGDAVISCQFQYRVAIGTSIFGNVKQAIEIFAYGTAVKIRR
jgi:hypothetical protein